MIETIIDNNIDRIKTDLQLRGLSYESLLDDIIDHICCMVEEKMYAGSDFEKSYSYALDTIEDGRLPEIEHQTLLLLNKKFQDMKKFTYIFGLSSAILVLIGTFFKIMHFPGAGIALTLGLGAIVLVFLPLYFFITYKEQTEKKSILFPVIGYITLALLLTGAIFKTQHWPGAGKMIELSLAFLVIGFVPLYVVNAFQKVKKGKISLPYIIMLMVGVAIITLTFNVKMGLEEMETYRTASLLNEERTSVTIAKTEKLLNSISDTSSENKESILMIHSKSLLLQDMVNDMLGNMLAKINQPGIGVAELKRLEQEGVGRDIILDSGWGKEFITLSREYMEMLVDLVDDPVAKVQIKDHLEYTGAIWFIEWGPRDVMYDPVIKIYYKHTDVLKGIALGEYVAISNLLHN